MATIKTADLIAKFQYALDNKWGYVLNTWHTMWTQALQNAKVKYMTDKYGSNWKSTGKGDGQYYNALYCGKWIGHYVTDCSGLFYWAFKELGGYMYHGSNTMWKSYCTSKGKLTNGKRSDGKELKPGSAVFVLKGDSNRSHVGLYIGNDTVIEASGQDVGVITSKITNKKWAEWAELKGVDYSNATTTVPVSTPVQKEDTSVANEEKKTGTVNATRVALRTGPSTKDSIILRVDKGEKVEIQEPEWSVVSYKGKTGYMMTKFIDK